MTSTNTASAIYARIHGDEEPRTPTERGIIGAAPVSLYAMNAGSAVVVGTATVSNVGLDDPTSLQRKLHGHDVPSAGGQDLIVIRATTITEEYCSLPYTYTFNTTDSVPETLADVLHAGMYVWDTNAMKVQVDDDVVETGFLDVRALNNKKRSERGTDDDAKGVSDEFNSGSGEAISVRKYNRNDYKYVDMEVNIDQLVDVELPLRDVDESHVAELKELFISQHMDYSLGSISATPLLLHGKKLSEMTAPGNILILGDILGVLDGRHRLAAILLLRAEFPDINGPHGWVHRPIKISVLVRRDDEFLTGREIMLTSNQKNEGAKATKKELTFMEQLKKVVNYSRAFEREYNVPFIQARISDIVEDMRSSQYIPGEKSAAHSVSTYHRYARVAKLIRIREPVMDLLKRLALTSYESGGVKNQLGLLHLDSRRLFAQDAFTTCLFLQAADMNVKNSKRKGSFPAKVFYSECVSLLSDLTDIWKSLPEDRYSSLQEFLEVKIPKTKGKPAAGTVSIRELFFNNIKCLSHDSTVSSGAGRMSQAQSRRNAAFNRVKAHFFVPANAGSARTPSKRSGGDDIQLLDSLPPQSKRRHTRAATARGQSRPVNSNTGMVSQRNASPPGSAEQVGFVPDKEDIVEPKKQTPRKKGDRRGGVSEPIVRDTSAQGLPTVDATETATNSGDTVSAAVIDKHGKFKDVVDKVMPFGYKKQKITPQKLLTVRELRKLRHPPCLRRPNFLKVLPKKQALLQSVMIPATHRARLFVKDSQDFLAMYYVAWACACVNERKRLRDWPPPQSVDHLQDVMNCLSVYGYSFLERARAEVEHQGFTVLESFVDPLETFPALKTQSDSGIPKVVRDVSIKELFAAILDTFPGEDNMALQMNGRAQPCGTWAPIVNFGHEEQDKEARLSGKARYTSLPKLLMEGFEREKDTVAFAERRAYLDVWIGTIAALLRLDQDGADVSWLPATGGRFLLSGKDVEDQCGHNDFCVRKEGSPGYFVIATGAEAASINVCPGSHRYVHYHNDRKELLVRALEMQEVPIPAMSLFIGHGYVQHGGTGWRGTQSLRYHTYIAPAANPIPDAIAFGYNWSMKPGDGNSGMVRETRRSTVIEYQSAEEEDGEEGGDIAHAVDYPRE